MTPPKCNPLDAPRVLDHNICTGGSQPVQKTRRAPQRVPSKNYAKAMCCNFSQQSLNNCQVWSELSCHRQRPPGAVQQTDWWDSSRKTPRFYIGALVNQSNSKKWRPNPKYRYVQVRRQLRRRRHFGDIKLSCPILRPSFAGPKSSKGGECWKPTSPMHASTLSARVRCGHPPHLEPPSSLQSIKYQQAGKSGKSRKQQKSAVKDILTGHPALTGLVIFAGLARQSEAVQTGRPVYPCTISPDLSRARKRSFIRAVRRADSQGQAWYKGRWFTLNALKEQYQGQQKDKFFQRPPKVHSSKRLRVLSMNVGGLSTDAYDELLHKLNSMAKTDRPHIVLVQETHWAMSMDYQTPGWLCVHSAHEEQPRAAGLLILISDALIGMHDIRIDSPQAGRIQHIRMFLAECTVDIVHVYQKVHIAGSSGPAMKERAQVWEKLNLVLKRIPQRNICVVAGDFNTPMEPIGNQTGPKIPTYNQNVPTDQESLTNIVLEHNLVHLNSWVRKATATFVAPKSQTLIDHIWTPKALADAQARKAHPVDLQLFAWRLGGRHIPVQASIPLPPITKLNRPRPAGAQIIDHIGMACAGRTANHGQLHRMRTAVQIRVQAERPTVEDMNRILREEAIKFFPGKRKQGQVVPWQQHSVGTSVKHMWQCYKNWRTNRDGSIPGIFKMWKQYADFKKAHKTFRKNGREERRNWLKAQIHEMEQAANRKDTRTLFNLARKIAPKNKRTTIQLRDEDGRILSKEQELDALAEFYKELFTHQKPLPPPVDHPIQLDLTEEEVAEHFKHLSAFKAAPASLAPAAAWKACQDVVIPWLVSCGRQLHTIPQTWRNSWLALIPKVSRPTIPRQLRPIGLTEVSGRIIAGIIQTRLRPYVQSYLKNLPQYAYLPERSTHDAIRRAQAHCQAIFRTCRGRETSVLEKYRGKTGKKQPTAGLQFSLDLSQAFDRMERNFLVESMQDAAIPHDLQSIILQWMETVQYVIPHQGLSSEIDASRGLRQGCKISPLLWALFTGLFMHKLMAQTSIHWVVEQLTAYADDFHTAHTMHNARELEKELTKVGIMFDLLEQMGMQVNSKKSAALFRVRGSFAKKWLQKNTAQTKEGLALKVRRPSGKETLIPIKEEHVYLGVKISFRQLSTPTVQHRRQIVAAAWSRLKPVLCKRSSLSLQHKVKIWRACIPPMMQHGLTASHVRSDDFQRVRTMLIKQLRAIAKSPVHLYHESTQDLLSRLQIPDPWDMLHHEAEQQWQNWQARAEANPGSILACQAEGQLVRETAERIAALRANAMQDPDTQQKETPPERGPHVCSICKYEAVSHRLLRSHQARAHGLKVSLRTQMRFDRTVHAKQGLPICALCHREFHLWTNLEKHITTGQCQGVAEGQALQAVQQVADLDLQQQPVACRAELMRRIREEGWQSLLKDKPLCSLLQSHCPLCHQWAATASGLKKHLSTHHPEWEHNMKHMLTLAAITKSTITRPCQWCMQTSFDKGRHWKQCHVVLSLTFLQCLAGSQTHHDVPDGGARALLWGTPGRCQTGGGREPGTKETSYKYGSLDASERQRKRQGQTQQPSRRQASITEWARSGKRPDPADGSPSDPSRILAQFNASGYDVSFVSENWGRQSNWPALQGRPEMETDQRREATGSSTIPEGMLVSIATCRVQDPASELQAPRDHRSVCQGARLDQPRGSLDLRQMEPRRRTSSDPDASAPKIHRDSSSGHPGPTGAHGQQHPQILFDPKVNGESGVSMDRVPVGDLLAGRRNQSVGNPASVDWPSGPASVGRQTSAGAPRTQWSCPDATELTVAGPYRPAGDPDAELPAKLKCILRAALHNPGNHCYMNHTVLCMLWCHEQLALADIHASPLLVALLNSLRVHPILSLMQYMPWTCLVQEWSAPHQQHDAAEFATFIMPRLAWGQMMGQWEARISVGDNIEIRDRHSAQSPISLTLSPGQPSLNACVQTWHSQAALHALASRVPLICLQIMRFRQVARGTWLKDQLAIEWGDTVQVPCFTNSASLEVSWLTYQIVAISLHIGARPDAGHYRSLLTNAGQHWITEDARAADKIDRPTPEHQRQAYLFWCVLSSGRSDANNPHMRMQTEGMRSASHPSFSTRTYTEVEGTARSGDTLHVATWN